MLKGLAGSIYNLQLQLLTCFSSDLHHRRLFIFSFFLTPSVLSSHPSTCIDEGVRRGQFNSNSSRPSQFTTSNRRWSAAQHESPTPSIRLTVQKRILAHSYSMLMLISVHSSSARFVDLFAPIHFPIKTTFCFYEQLWAFTTFPSPFLLYILPLLSHCKYSKLTIWEWKR